MAIKHGSKVDKSFSASSMTDLMFLLLLFLLIATTLINPNALKLMLPKSSNQLKDKAMTTVSIQDAGHDKYRYYVELQEVGSIEGVERALKTRLDGQKDATVSLHCDETVAVGETVKVMNIAKDNNYKLILATAPICRTPSGGGSRRQNQVLCIITIQITGIPAGGRRLRRRSTRCC